MPLHGTCGVLALVAACTTLVRAADLPLGVRPYDWALEQMRIPTAHETTRGSKEIVVAVIDLGYTHHPDLDGHLWENPNSTRGDRHGWDFHDDDATLEYSGANADSHYFRSHHVFVAGEVAAVAPECPLMILRVGYKNHDSWWRAIRYAVDNGAKVLVIPHGYIGRAPGSDVPLFYQGTDFAYPADNPKLREALDYAFDKGCLVIKGTADNRGRRVAFAESALEMVCAVGSLDRRDRPASHAGSCDYVEFAAPAGDPGREVWGCAGGGGYCAFHGGCMASGFAGGVAALVWSRHPELTNEQVRQVLRNTCRTAEGVTPDADGWDPQTGYGILDAGKAVSLPGRQLCRDVRLVEGSARLIDTPDGPAMEVELENAGAWDAEKAMIVAYNGDPTRPVSPEGTFDAPAATLQTTQLGHAIMRVRGLHRSRITVALSAKPTGTLWFETFCLDRHDVGHLHRTRAAPWTKSDESADAPGE